jgi:putative endopeptidase
MQLVNYRSRRFVKAVLLVLPFAVAGCKSAQQSNLDSGSKPDILRANMDTTVNPGQDFFMYANGGWFKRNPIPASESRWGIGNLVQNEIYDRLRTISEDASKNTSAAKGTPEQMIGDLYASAMDSVTIDKGGLQPLQDELQQIKAVHDLPSLVSMIATLQQYQVGPAFDMYASQDERNSNKMVLHISQGGLGMPNRDYYINDDTRTQNVRKEYVNYLQQTFTHVDTLAPKAAGEAAQVFDIEKALAQSSRKLEDLRDPISNYHKMTVKELDKLTPNINWENFLAGIGGKSIDTVIVGQPEFFKALNTDLKKFPLEAWKDYLKWQLINSYSNQLGGDIEKEHFHFYRTVLTGAKEQKPRWKRTIDYENQAIGELLGKQFVQNYFPPETKQRYEKLADAIILAYRQHIQSLDWMSDSTKQKALYKLSKITKKVGYPDKWKDFSGMDINRTSFARNAVNINKWWFNYNLNKIGKPVDRTEWDMNPQEYNAYYNPSNNEIVLPAAIFAVPGYKDNELDDAVIYGYAGASTIGHELTHGFDDEGRLYDAQGNLQDWWTKQDAAQFLRRSQRYVNQFNQFVVLDSLHVNGKASLGENIADLGGIVIGLDAFKQTDEYKNGKTVAGLTPLQRYFLGYALGWLVEQRDEQLANQILTDVHAPAKYRVNGPMSNVPDFYKAFNLKPGQAMFRSDTSQVKIW